MARLPCSGRAPAFLLREFTVLRFWEVETKRLILMAGINHDARGPAILFSRLVMVRVCSFLFKAEVHLLSFLVLWAFGAAAPDALGQFPLHPTVPESVGFNIHFTDARPGEMEMLASTGVGWIRMDFIWGNTERQRGQYDFSAYDRLMAALGAHRIKALLIFDGGNSLYDGGRFPYTDEGREAFVRWAVAGVRHFRGQGVLWEMWNEPNDYTRDNPKVDVYTKLALAVGEAIQKVAPKENYIGPATSLIDMPFLEGCFKAGLLCPTVWLPNLRWLSPHGQCKRSAPALHKRQIQSSHV